ncbi:MAG: ATPase, T2SS/T4P/T4SS family [Planctomycetota bacterium]
MSAPLKQHLYLWRTLADELDAGLPLLICLQRARASVAGSALEEAIKAIIGDITGGASLSDALARHQPLFSRCVVAMVRAGEAGGVLDVIARRIADGLEDGSFPLPGTPPSDEDPERACRAFGRLLSSGVPILHALDLVRDEICGPELAEAAEHLRQAIHDGQSMAEAMRQRPDLFPEEICLAVQRGEMQGNLDELAFRVADAIETADLTSLAPEGDTPQAPDASRQAPATIEIVSRILTQAVRDQASDVHFEPHEEGLKVRCRIDGALYEMQPPPPDLAGHIINRLKIMGDMDIAERRLPQDARIHIDIDGKPYDLRVSTVPTVHGERVAIRILDRQAVRLDLERIGFTPQELATVRELCHLPNGILIANGPAGSGKTTLLYAMLREIDRDRCCVLSAEDPVEYLLPGVAQIQIEPRRGLTYARALRSILRQDPDAIMVGELRDLETVKVAVQCSLTGHLLMTTMHANTSPGALRRLLDVGLEPFLVNSAVAGVLSQRLVRMLCPECRVPVEPPLTSIPPAGRDFINEHTEATFYAPSAEGCERCHGTGFRGRTAIHEILVPGERVRQAVVQLADLSALRDAALAEGMTPMLISGLEKAAAGVTSVQEVCRVVPHGIHA